MSGCWRMGTVGESAETRFAWSSLLIPGANEGRDGESAAGEVLDR